MRLALDANRYADYMRGTPDVVQLVSGAAAVALPFIVLAELRAGFRYGTQTRQNERVLSEFLTEERVRILWPDVATTHLYADLFAELRSAGQPVPTNDIWIAALCIQYGCVLYSRDRHFERMPRLARV